MTAERFASRLLLDRHRLLCTAFWATVAGGGAGVVLATGEGLPPPSAGGSPIPSDARPASRAGILVLVDRCTRPYARTDARCPVVWRPDSDFLGVTGGFRCPCCGSAFTRAGLRIFGPAWHPLDTFAAHFEPDGTLVVNTTRIVWGGSDNPQRVVPLP